jgi:peptidoglycan/LPS O-acetylase OafA/YrhL
MYGSLLALLDGEPRLERFFSRPSSLVSVILLLAFALIVDPFMQQKFRGGYALTLGLSLVSLSFVFAIAWLLRRPASLPARGLNLPLVAGVGTLSYSLYLWQQPFMWPPNSSISGRFPTDLLFVVAAASASYFLVEKPFMRLRQRFRPL